MTTSGAGTRDRSSSRQPWLMLPLLIVSYLIAYAVGSLLLTWLSVPEGRLLSSAGAWGWTAAIVVLLIAVSPLVAGVVLAGRVIRRAPSRSARWALVMNGLMLGWLVIVQLVELARA